MNKFSKPNKEEKVHDEILNKEVSSIVFMKNLKLVQDAYKSDLTLEYEQQQEIKARA